MLGDSINGTLRRGLQRIGGSNIVPDRRAGIWMRDDLVNLLGLGTSVAGTGSASETNEAAGRPGVVTLGVTAVATPDRAVVHNGAGNGSMKLGGGPMALEADLRIPGLSNGVDNITVRAGIMISTSGDEVDGCYFENDYANHANSNNWFACTAAASVRTKTDCGIAPTANVWTRLRIEIDSAAANVVFKVDDVVRATLTTNITPNVVIPFMVQATKQLGAGLMTVQLDYYEFTQTFSSSR